jgi:hypothetical protein
VAGEPGYSCQPRRERGDHLLRCCGVACFAGRGRAVLRGLPGAAADPAEVPDRVAGDPTAGDLASVLIPGEERGAGCEADIRSLSCHLCPACLRAWSGRSRWRQTASARRCGCSSVRDGLLFMVSPPTGPAGCAADLGQQAPCLLAGRRKTEAVTHCPHGRNSPARSPSRLCPWWRLPS